MNVKTLARGPVFAIGLGAALLWGAAYRAVGEASGTGMTDFTEFSAGRAAATKRNLNVAQPAQAGGVVAEWNLHAVRLTLSTPPAIQAALAPVEQTRVMAIFHAALHDAVNGITGRFATNMAPALPPADASPEAAAIAAAHHALKALFPNQTALPLDDLYAASLAAHGLSEFDPGVDFGRSVAAAILAARAGDGSAQAQYPYTAPGAGSPGVWVPISAAPNAQALLPGWGDVTPFVLRSGSQFRPDPPPALDTERYARDYNEVKSIGKSDSPTRTAQQAQIAQFWLASPTAIWNPVIAQVVQARGLDLSSTARAYGLFYLAAADASIACWDAKYAYNFWRPQLAIRGGDTDGNNLTEADPTWLPLHTTARHPEYPSGHTTNSGAMAAVLTLLFGDDPGAPVEVTVSGITRRWETFGEGIAEVIDARIYSGIHFRTADEVGARLGRQVARFVSTHALRPCPKGRPRCS